MKRKTENGKWKTESGKLRVENGKLSTFHFPLSTLHSPLSVFHFLLCLLLLSSCGVRKKLVPPTTHVSDYEWMTAKMIMDLTAPGVELKDVSGTLRMRRDSTVWISASALMGMENIRAMITQDSLVLINRVDQTYLAEPLSEVAEKLQLPATLQECQTLLLGNGNADHVELQLGPYTAKIRYSDIQWDNPTSFPMKINPKYERMKL